MQNRRVTRAMVREGLAPSPTASLPTNANRSHRRVPLAKPVPVWPGSSLSSSASFSPSSSSDFSCDGEEYFHPPPEPPRWKPRLILWATLAVISIVAPLFSSSPQGLPPFKNRTARPSQSTSHPSQGLRPIKNRTSRPSQSTTQPTVAVKNTETMVPEVVQVPLSIFDDFAAIMEGRVKLMSDFILERPHEDLSGRQELGSPCSDKATRTTGLQWNALDGLSGRSEEDLRRWIEAKFPSEREKRLWQEVSYPTFFLDDFCHQMVQAISCWTMLEVRKSTATDSLSNHSIFSEIVHESMNNLRELSWTLGIRQVFNDRFGNGSATCTTEYMVIFEKALQETIDLGAKQLCFFRGWHDHLHNISEDMDALAHFSSVSIRSSPLYMESLNSSGPSPTWSPPLCFFPLYLLPSVRRRSLEWWQNTLVKKLKEKMKRLLDALEPESNFSQYRANHTIAVKRLAGLISELEDLQESHQRLLTWARALIESYGLFLPHNSGSRDVEEGCWIQDTWHRNAWAVRRPRDEGQRFGRFCTNPLCPKADENEDSIVVALQFPEMLHIIQNLSQAMDACIQNKGFLTKVQASWNRDNDRSYRFHW